MQLYDCLLFVRFRFAVQHEGLRCTLMRHSNNLRARDAYGHVPCLLTVRTASLRLSKKLTYESAGLTGELTRACTPRCLITCCALRPPY